MIKSKKLSAGGVHRTPIAITCSHCGSEDVAYEGLVEVVSAAAGMKGKKVERYTCFACRRTFDRPRGDLLRSTPLTDLAPIPVLPVGQLSGFEPLTTLPSSLWTEEGLTVQLPDETPEEPKAETPAEGKAE